MTEIVNLSASTPVISISPRVKTSAPAFSIKNENVREIHLNKSMLIINRYKDFSFVLLTTQISKSLVTALNTFSAKFVNRFEELLAQGVFTDPKDHETASTIVADCFPFLPS